MGRYYMHEEIIEIYESSTPVQIGYDHQTGQLFISQQAREEVKRIVQQSANQEDLQNRLLSWAQNQSHNVVQNQRRIS